MGEFLPIIVAIIFGLYSLFKRNMSDQEGEKKKPFLPPNLDPMHPKHFGKQNAPEAPSQPQQIEKPKVELMSNPEERIGRQDYQTKAREHTFKQEPIKINKVKKLNPTIQKLNKQRLVEGVIMAEILGSPRAHQPHHTRSAKKLSK
ncbi:hypothetical protein [Bacillus sp. AK128]